MNFCWPRVRFPFDAGYPHHCDRISMRRARPLPIDAAAAVQKPASAVFLLRSQFVNNQATPPTGPSLPVGARLIRRF
jgi:hypothetical protein